MTSHRSRLPIRTLLAALMIVPPAAVLLSIPWLKQQPNELVFLLTGLAGFVAVLASLGLALLYDRQMDEWERSNARFSSQWGWTGGACLVAVLLLLPPFRDQMAALVGTVTSMPDADAKVIVVAFTFGLGAVVFAQVICTALLSIGWTLWMSRGARDPS